MISDRTITCSAINAATRAGPRMKQAARFVAENPGCSIKRVAEHLMDSRVNPDRSLSGGYAVVHRAIAAGLITARRGPGWRAKYELTPATPATPGTLPPATPATPGTLPPATPATPGS